MRLAPAAAAVRLFDAASGTALGTAQMARIELRNVTNRYGNSVAVQNVSFTGAGNEFYGLFGPPLSGKTTILRLILGLETPDVGQILIDGQPVNLIGPAARSIAMVF